MKNITFTVVTLVIIGLCIAIGYLALVGMRDPAYYVNQSSDQVGDLLDIQSPDTTETISPEIPVVNVPLPPETKPAPSPDNLNASLIASLEKAKTAETILKLGSRGDTVRAVQEFLNLYFKTSVRADGDFGKTTESNYKKFQAAQQLPQTGQVGTQGFTKMIEWLENN